MLIKNLKILIVEDEVLIAEYLKSILESFEIVHIEMAHEKESALKKISAGNFDLILLDIRLEKELQGIEIAVEIQKKSKISFIFLTAHSDLHTINSALETNPFTYLTKPLKKMDIYSTLNVFVRSITEKESKHLFVKEGNANIKINFSDILFVKSIGNYIKIYTSNESFNVRNSLEWITEILPEETFKRAHRSYLVNVSKIEKHSKKNVSIGSFEIPISRNFATVLD